MGLAPDPPFMEQAMSGLQIVGLAVLGLVCIAVVAVVMFWMIELDEWEDPVEAESAVSTTPVTHRVWCQECFRVAVPFDAFEERILCPACVRQLAADLTVREG